MKYAAFVVELSKLAGGEGLELADDAARQRKQTLAYTALGALSGPVIGGVSNLIQHGHPWPRDVSVRRWLPAAMATGALSGGLMPVVRRRVDDALSKGQQHAGT